ncbi:MAG: transketolase-like TK C-terminal-containing protein, partial [Acidimicrobiales bacterium]
KPEEIEKTKEILGLPPDESFWVPDAVLEFYRRCVGRGEALHAEWQERFDASDVDRSAWEAAWSGRALEGWEAKIPTFEAGEDLATRRAINKCINATIGVIPGLVAGAADLTENTGVQLEGGERQSPEHPGGRQLYFGIREHAMGAAMTGMAMHGGILPVGGTFFTFSDYMRPAVRLAAMSRAHVIYAWTHDSIGVGEDGPTHEPIEQLPSLRAMPGLTVVRPADANECAQAWRCAVEADQPVALILSRQGIPVLSEAAERAAEGLARGGYVLRPESGSLDLVLVGTGSEVHLCLGAADALAGRGHGVRVVSLPCWEWFEDQDDGYRASVLPDGVPTLSVEAASAFGWDRYADASVSIETYGASGASKAVLEHFGFTVERVTERALALLAQAEG